MYRSHAHAQARLRFAELGPRFLSSNHRPASVSIVCDLSELRVTLCACAIESVPSSRHCLALEGPRNLSRLSVDQPKHLGDHRSAPLTSARRCWSLPELRTPRWPAHRYTDRTSARLRRRKSPHAALDTMRLEVRPSSPLERSRTVSAVTDHRSVDPIATATLRRSRIRAQDRLARIGSRSTALIRNERSS